MDFFLYSCIEVQKLYRSIDFFLYSCITIWALSFSPVPLWFYQSYLTFFQEFYNISEMKTLYESL